jgi:hypothetical protein
MNKASIGNFAHPPLARTSAFLGGFKKVLDIPHTTSNDNDQTIAGKQANGVSDEKFKNSAPIADSMISMVVVFISMVILMKHN